MIIRQSTILLHLCLIISLWSCGSSPSKPASHLHLSKQKISPAPCWISSPQCLEDESKSALYFVGQSAQPSPGEHRPSREAFKSAQKDAEKQYASYLGVDVKSSSLIQSLINDEQSSSQFTETTQTTVKRTVSHLVKAGEYFFPEGQNEKGEILWTAFILLKIDRDAVKKHEQLIAEEKENQKNKSHTSDSWIVSVFNIDDSASIFVNGTKINQCGFSRSCDVRLNPHLRQGINHIRLEYTNHIGGWTYGYKVTKNDEIMYEGRCGQVWFYGCKLFNFKTGVMHQFKFQIDQ